MFEISRHTLILIVAGTLVGVGCAPGPGVEPPMNQTSKVPFDAGTTYAADKSNEGSAAGGTTGTITTTSVTSTAGSSADAGAKEADAQ
jgi:hypothetical protein